MADEVIAETIQSMTFVSQDDIKAALEKALQYDVKGALQATLWTLGSQVSPSPAAKAAASWASPEIKLHSFAFPTKSTEPTNRTPVRQSQHVHMSRNGAKGGSEVEQPPRFKTDMFTGPKSTVASLWKAARYQPAKAGDGAFDVPTTTTQGHRARKGSVELLMDAAEKCGIPKTKTDMLAAHGGKIENVIKAATTRQGVREAVLGGACHSAALTAAFDITRLFDGDFKTHFANTGIRGLRDGCVAGLSSWITDPFFGNGTVLGVVVGSAFGAASLASTGDWAHFARGLESNVVGGATAWGGATAGAALGSLFGPVGTTLGGVVGGVCGGIAARQVAGRLPGLGARPALEVAQAAGAIRQQLAAAGLEPDPSLSAEQLVGAAMAKGAGHGQAALQVRMTHAMAAQVTDLRELLADLHQVSPEVLLGFRDLLRAVRGGV